MMSSDFENDEFVAFLEEQQFYFQGELVSSLLADEDRVDLEKELGTVLAALRDFDS